jgi:hypothetical protein
MAAGTGLHVPSLVFFPQVIKPADHLLQTRIYKAPLYLLSDFIIPAASTMTLALRETEDVRERGFREREKGGEQKEGQGRRKCRGEGTG